MSILYKLGFVILAIAVHNCGGEPCSTAGGAVGIDLSGVPVAVVGLLLGVTASSPVFM